MLQAKREQSREVVVPSAMTEQELADFFSRLTGATRGEGRIAVDELDSKDWRSSKCGSPVASRPPVRR